MRKLKKLWISLALVLSPILMYEALSMAKYWQSEKIEVTGYQIAKRVNPTRNGDRFSVLLDTEYGMMEIPVSYATYITSSNNCKHSWKIDYLLHIMDWIIPLNCKRHTLSCSMILCIAWYGYWL